MQSEMFEETRNEDDTAHTRTVGLSINAASRNPRPSPDGGFFRPSSAHDQSVERFLHGGGNDGKPP